MAVENINEWMSQADSRETSPEIMEAIWDVAPGARTAEDIWTAPTEAELAAIWERATKNGSIPAGSLCWGDAGSNWAGDEENAEDDGERTGYLVHDAEDNGVLGIPSDELVAESLAVDTGCVPARYDPVSGVWEYVLPYQAGSDARTVYVRRI